MYKVVLFVACLSVALGQYEQFRYNYPDGEAYPYNDNLNTPLSSSEIQQQYGQYEEGDDGNPIRYPPSHPTDTNYSPRSGCPPHIRPHQFDRTKFFLGGKIMSCPATTFFDPSICTCNHIARPPRY